MSNAAPPYEKVAAFMSELREQDGTPARALEFAILTVTCIGAVINATWQEIDLEKKLWTIPAERTIAGREHRVPLSNMALALIAPMIPLQQGDFVFPEGKPNRPLSKRALLMILLRMKRKYLTVDVFRSTFWDWATEQTSFPAEVAEMALAHAVGDKVEATLRHNDLFVKRQELMEAWALYLRILEYSEHSKGYIISEEFMKHQILENLEKDAEYAESQAVITRAALIYERNRLRKTISDDDKILMDKSHFIIAERELKHYLYRDFINTLDPLTLSTNSHYNERLDKQKKIHEEIKGCRQTWLCLLSEVMVILLWSDG